MKFYKCGFSIIGSTGNNEFSFKERNNKEIFVPALVNTKETVSLEEGDLAFCEIDEGIEHICKGLKQFFYFVYKGKNVYIFDNHNHSFFFTVYEKLQNDYEDLKIIHIDQHKDMRSPIISFEEYQKYSSNKRKEFINKNTKDFFNSYDFGDDPLKLAYEYGNLVLNVGNYLVPLLDAKFITKVDVVDSSQRLKDLELFIIEDYCLNIDLDFFSKDMDYINFSDKVKKIKKAMDKSKFITIATSPYFIDLDRCITALKELFL